MGIGVMELRRHYMHIVINILKLPVDIATKIVNKILATVRFPPRIMSHRDDMHYRDPYPINIYSSPNYNPLLHANARETWGFNIPRRSMYRYGIESISGDNMYGDMYEDSAPRRGQLIKRSRRTSWGYLQ